MNLSDEQRGEIRHEAKADDGGSSMENGDDDRNLKVMPFGEIPTVVSLWVLFP